MYQKSLKWVNHVSIYRSRSRSRGHLTSSKRSSGCFFIKESRENTFSHEPLAISHDNANWKIHELHFRLSGAFHMTVRNFRMVMRNQLWDFPLICSKKFLLVHFTWSCEIFFNFFPLNPPQPPPSQLQSPVQTNCITSFIMHLDHHQLYLFSSIWVISFATNLSKSYLEMTPKLHKTC